ncbi:MAG: multidrug efflux SMR transporter [Arcobacteraceae bacterium]|nr:multidrug efflux SMR transporter [Arcobacteraceae bacterium]
MTGWLYLIAAGVLEIGFASMIKPTENFTKVIPTIVFIIFAFGSFYMLTKAVEYIPIGTAYAVWTGIGAVGTVIIGMVIYNDPINTMRIFFLCTLIGSIIGLKLVS